MSQESYQSAREKLLRARNGDIQARDELVRENIALVRYIVKRFAGRSAEYEDLFQYGCLGLLKAVDRFDPDYPVRFSTYAVPVIMGEIRRYLRDDGPIHVSRTIHDRARQVTQYVETYREEHGEEPTVEQIAAALGIESEDVVLAMNSRNRVRSLNEPVAGECELRLMDVVGTDPMQAVDQRLTLKKLLGDLPEEERVLIVRRFFQCHTQTQIANDMGTSQVQVSRMEKRALRHMRELSGT